MAQAKTNAARQLASEEAQELRDERAIKRARTKRQDPDTELILRTHPEEPDVKVDADERRTWKIMELLPDTGTYSAFDRLDALTAFATTGRMAEVERLVPQVKPSTLSQWKNNSEWWKPALRRVREMLDEEFDARLTSIMHRSLDAMDERLEKGDEHVTKDGEVIRRKVSFRDLSVGGVAVPYDKRALGRGDPTVRTEVIADKDRLSKLQQQFKQIAKTRIINITPDRNEDSPDENRP